MSQTTTLILLPQTTYNGGGTANIYKVSGNTQPAAAYYLGNQDLQTISYSFTNVTGTLEIEATLASAPSEGDWFKVYDLVANANAPANSAPLVASNASIYTNINGNFVFLRAKVKDFNGGIVNFVKLSY
jgi:hypothetical protein